MLDTCSEKADWDADLFRRYSLSYEKLTKKSKEANHIDIFNSLRYFVKFMSSDDEILMGKILSKHFEETQQLTISYDDFLEKCNFRRNV